MSGASASDPTLCVGRRCLEKALVTGLATAVKTISFQFPLCQRVSRERVISVRQLNAWLRAGALAHNMDVQLETILNSIEDAVLSIDDDSIILFLNEAAGRLFGCVPAHAVGQPVARYSRMAEAVEQLKLDEPGQAGRPAKSIRRLHCARLSGGEAIPMEASVSSQILSKAISTLREITQVLHRRQVHQILRGKIFRPFKMAT